MGQIELFKKLFVFELIAYEKKAPPKKQTAKNNLRTKKKKKTNSQ